MTVTLRVGLPKDRTIDGECVLVDDHHATIGGPWACHGKADATYATAHANPERDPLKIGGDTPCGLYRMASVTSYVTYSSTYGWAFGLLEPQDGDAKDAEKNGRTGIGLHSGVPDTHGNLRATYGCLRVNDACLASVVAHLGLGPVYVQIDEQG